MEGQRKGLIPGHEEKSWRRMTIVNAKDHFLRELHSTKNSFMKQNMGNADRLIRTIIAVMIGVLYYYSAITGVLAIVLLVVAAIFIVTSFFAYCPLYSLFGIKTCRTRIKN
jgi:uncharacterized membrane protein